MTPEAQRIAIAKACGWVGFHKRNVAFEPHAHGHLLCGTNPNAECGHSSIQQVPNYRASLDAMHVAEETLTADQWTIYVQRLKFIVSRDKWPHELGYYIHATAAQKAEAFLRALHLWIEDTTTKHE